MKQARLFAGTVILATVAAAAAAVRPAAAAEPEARRTVFVQLFEWRWSDVARECETYLGPKGFAAVQISPPQEHVVLPAKGFPWWQSYQPVSYKLESRLGTREEFKDMVARCRAAGVAIYADVVMNHMAAGSGSGSAGSSYGPSGDHQYSFPGLYGAGDFHWNVSGAHNCQGNVDNYQNQHAVQDCELVGLPDLATELPDVRTHLIGYLADLHGLGVQGYRIDAAKHMDPSDLGTILGQLRAKVGADVYVVQEVIDLGGEAVKRESYYDFGDVDDFVYGRKLAEQFRNANGQRIANLRSFGDSWGLARSDRAVVFIDNHDMQRDASGAYLTFKDNNQHFVYTLANVFMMAWPYGYPQLMSSYDFSDFDQGPPSDDKGQVKNIYKDAKATDPSCFKEWKCEHRWREIGNMVAFRNATAATGQVVDWWDDGSDAIAFGRGDRGFVVINREDSPLDQTFDTHLPPGTYCDVIAGDVTQKGAKAGCSGQQITVDDKRRAHIKVPANYAAALHVGAMTAARPMVEVTFEVSLETQWGQNVYVVGADPGLGTWAPAKALLMSAEHYPRWRIETKLPPGKSIPFKFIVVDGAGIASWESIPNRTLKTPAKGSVDVTAVWNAP
jgi:alpha-amylase